MMEEYYTKVRTLLEKILIEEKQAIEEAADLIVASIKEGGILHVIGAGHSAMAGEELFYRAGGLASVNPILDSDINISHGAQKSTAMEKIPGYARVLLESAGIRENDALLVVSTSGVNQFPVEAAMVGKEKKLKTIGITSVSYSKTLEPKNEYGKRLFEVVDVVIDNKVPPGDAVIKIGDLTTKVAPVSTITNCFIVNSLVIKVVEKLLNENITPPIWISAHLPEAKLHNSRLFKEYRERIKLL
ncbi:SIS domain-containing protein [Pyrococcus kukulkanii]|uniref:SIS domain-containing protein n=1 Tax=Pyrococcus kukulkanii TaxID=1609559 RepID=A0ABV4T3B6_9EURY